MRSKAHVLKGHPLHPMFVHFPLAFLIGALVADVIGRMSGKSEFWVAGAHLTVAGVAAGAFAGIFGFIDYYYTVPPNSTGKKRARNHMILNIMVLLLFAFARYLRGDAHVPPDLPIIGVEAVAVGLLLWSGWMGGVLVYRNQIGVDHRYAQAGKWQDESYHGEAGGVSVARRDELKVNQMKLLRVNGTRIVLARTERGYVAFDDHCTHRGGSLAGGAMICGTVQCPWHGSQFDVATGEVRAGPAKEGIKTYRVEESGDVVKLRL
jgi:uncharacterized membrane protein/nitrite reductase/ring-hydroxylating ferredoxin subunit